MLKTILFIATAIALLIVFGYKNNNDVYTLIRSSPAGDDMRIHVATFDSNTNSFDGSSYNLGNCNIARDLFLGQKGVTVKYWCEKGRFEE